MKLSLKKLILTSLIALTATTTFAREGGVIGNGGDEYSLQFIAVANQVVQYLSDTKTGAVGLEKIRTAVETTKVESTNKPLSLNGIPKDAINYPTEKRILFNRTAWKNLTDDARKAALVFHEYLGILGVDDTGYKVSKALLANLKHGRASGYVAQDALSPKVVRTTIQGELAKTMYHHLQVPVEIIPGSDGEQQTKFGKNIQCALMTGTQEYSCYLDVGPKGIEE